jgi:ferredoxin
VGRNAVPGTILEGGPSMSLVPEVDKSLCLSTGRCVADHPNAFAFDGDELAEVSPGASALSDDALRLTAAQCPAEAILLKDAAGNVVFP